VQHLRQHHTGHSPLSGVHLILMTLKELALGYQYTNPMYLSPSREADSQLVKEFLAL